MVEKTTYSRVERAQKESVSENYRMWKKGKTWLFAGTLLTAILGGTTMTTATAVQAATYTVKSGDTLWDIAMSRGMSLQQIEAANPQIPNYDLIFPNQVINIPDGQGSVNGQPQAPSASDYVVRLGDTLWGIAIAHGVTLPELFALNPQYSIYNSLIFPGDVIHLSANQVSNNGNTTPAQPARPGNNGNSGGQVNPTPTPAPPASEKPQAPEKPVTPPATDNPQTPEKPVTPPVQPPVSENPEQPVNPPVTDNPGKPDQPGNDQKPEAPLTEKEKLEQEARKAKEEAQATAKQATQNLENAQKAQAQANEAMAKAKEQAQLAQEQADQAKQMEAAKSNAKEAADAAVADAQQALEAANSKGAVEAIQASQKALEAAQAAKADAEAAATAAVNAANEAIAVATDANSTLQATQEAVNKANAAKVDAEQKAQVAAEAAQAAQTALEAAQKALEDAKASAQDAAGHNQEAAAVEQQVGETKKVVRYVDEAGQPIGDGTTRPGEGYTQVGQPKVETIKTPLAGGVQGQYTLKEVTTYVMHKAGQVFVTVNVDEAGNDLGANVSDSDYKLISSVVGKPVIAPNGDTVTTTTNTYHKIQHLVINVDEAGNDLGQKVDPKVYHLISTSKPEVQANGDTKVVNTYHKIQTIAGKDVTVNILDNTNQEITDTTGLVKVGSKTEEIRKVLENGDIVISHKTTVTYHKPVQVGKTVVVNKVDGKVVTGPLDTSNLTLEKTTQDHINVKPNGDYTLQVTNYYKSPSQEKMTWKEFQAYVAANMTAELEKKRQEILNLMPEFRAAIEAQGIDTHKPLYTLTTAEAANIQSEGWSSDLTMTAQEVADNCAKTDSLTHSVGGRLTEILVMPNFYDINNLSEAVALEAIKTAVAMYGREYGDLLASAVNGVPKFNGYNGHLFNIVASEAVISGVAISSKTGGLYIANHLVMNYDTFL